MTAPQAPESASLESRILALIVEIAPDIDPAAVDPDVELRAQFDFDSMDFLNLAVALHKTFGIDIPERDYRELASVARCASYLRERGL
jgi:acyl carrier protein